MTPLVSVVIPTRLDRPYIDEAVASVFDQTFEEWELIVVLDGVADDRRFVRPDDARVSFVRQPRLGLSAARNAGVAAARGDLVAFLDDDDRFRPEKLERQVERLDARPDAALCHTQFAFIDERGDAAGAGWAEPVRYDGMLEGSWGVATSTTMYRRSALIECGMHDSTFTMTGDLDLLFKVAARHEVDFIDDVLCDYRRHATGMSRDYVLQLREAETVFAKHRDLARRHGDRARARAAGRGLRDLRRHYAKRAIARAEEAARRRRWREAVRHLGIASALRLAVTPKLAARGTAGRVRP